MGVETPQLVTPPPHESRPQDVAALLAQLRSIVGGRHVLTGRKASRFVTGFRCGEGEAAAVVRPGSLVEQWRVLRACVDANVIVIAQAANTGLTGGSTPDGSYDRPVVLINMMRIGGVHLLKDGEQVVCLPGATLYGLEKALAPLAREPHSVIGSSCIGASVIGGVCNNSGGALVSRGPAYTQYALYARCDEAGELHLVNHLGIELGEEPETILARIEAGQFQPQDVDFTEGRAASDRDYAEHVRAVDANTPARFNADPRCLFEAAGSAGKIMLFAVRLDTFAQEKEPVTFYIGTNAIEELTRFRRDVLGGDCPLPISAEYIHRDAFDTADLYGKDMFVAIRYLGTQLLPRLFSLKNWVDNFTRSPNLSDRMLQAIGRLFPDHLPPRMRQWRQNFAHHLILKMPAAAAARVRDHLSSIWPSGQGDVFICTPEEARAAFLHRFVVAGAAIRYRAIHPREVEDIIALDVALRRNDEEWFETLPLSITRSIISSLYYGHFFCHVFHNDYIVKKGEDVDVLKDRMCEILNDRGAEYPAEHNVGHAYAAKPTLVDHYRALDPKNHFNPGIGHTSRLEDWRQ